MGTHKTIEERFLEGIVKTESGCWEWSGERQSGNYGIVRSGKQRVYAHRYSYETYVGMIPDGRHVCHHCDNPPCVNPEHLFIGTQSDNMQDAAHKGRLLGRNVPRGEMHPRRLHPELSQGERNGRSKLTEIDVLKIRELYPAGGISWHELAKRYGVSKTVIGHILSRKLWGSVGA